MFLRKLNLEPFYSPVAVADGKIAGLPSGKEDTIDFLKDDEPTDKEDVIDLEPKKDKDKKDEKLDDKDDKDDKKDDKEEKLEEEDDELKALEDELKEPDEEDLDLVVPVSRREILKKYPTVFKDFPYLEKAYYREQQFTEIFPTIDDAKNASAAVNTIAGVDKDLADGNIEKILLAAKETRGFNKIVDNYLETLAKVDEKAFHHVLGNMSKHIISSMSREGKRIKNEALENAAVILNQFIFGSSEYTPPSKLHVEDAKNDSDEDRVKAKEREINQREFEKTRNSLNTKVNNSIKATIEANIDPKQSMTDYVRRNAGREAMETLEDLISKDTRFKSIVDRLWDNAAKNDFDDESVNKIVHAFKSKARTLLPAVIKKARNEALKGMGKRVSDDKDEPEEKVPARNEKRTESRSQSNKSDKTKVPSGMSSYEFLNSDD